MGAVDDLNAACARALGKRIALEHGVWVDLDDVLPPSTPVDKYHTPSAWPMPIPSYATDPAAARELEDAIDARGLWAPYMMELFYLLGGDDPHAWARSTHAWRAWQCVRATPEQRARAFVQTLAAAP